MYNGSVERWNQKGVLLAVEFNEIVVFEWYTMVGFLRGKLELILTIVFTCMTLVSLLLHGRVTNFLKNDIGIELI